MSKKLIALASAMNECYETRNQFINDFSYHFGRTGRDSIFTNGNDYYAISKRKPTYECGKSWEPHPDQFWTKDLDTIIWISRATE